MKPKLITLTINTLFTKVKDGVKVVPDYLKKQHCEEANNTTNNRDVNTQTNRI